MPSYKYYVVWQGREPGIYDNWNECAIQVNDFPSHTYQGCNTLKDALYLWERGSQEEAKSAQQTQSSIQTSPSVMSSPAKVAKSVHGDTPARKVLKRERFSSGSHTYFFEVKETTGGSNYIVIDQRRKVGDAFESSKLRIFEDELLEFNRILQKMIQAALEAA